MCIACKHTDLVASLHLTRGIEDDARQRAIADMAEEADGFSAIDAKIAYGMSLTVKASHKDSRCGADGQELLF